MQTVTAAPQVPLKDLPPHLRRFLSPRRSMHGFQSGGAGRSVEVSRLSTVSSASAASSQAPPPPVSAAGAPTAGPPRPASPGMPPPPPASPAHPIHARSGSALSAATSPSRNVSHSSLGAAAAASALIVAGGTASQERVAASVAAGIRAAELNLAGAPPFLRAPLPPRPGSAGGAYASGTGGRASLDAGGRRTPPDLLPVHHQAGLLQLPAQLGGAGGAGDGSGPGDVTIELGELPPSRGQTRSEEGDDAGRRLLGSPGRPPW